MLKWGSENLVIPYVDTTRGNQVHRYIVDLFFEVGDPSTPVKWLIEIKPQSQAVLRTLKRKPANMMKYLNEAAVVERNKCKWSAAVNFCQARGWHFGVYTENGITKLC